MSAVSSFAMWFLAIKQAGKLAVVCPDSMSFVTDKSTEPSKKDDWMGLVSNLQVSYPNLVSHFILLDAVQCRHSVAKLLTP